MSYHIKDFIADVATIEKATLILNSIDLLESVNYYLHKDKLEDILMVIDSYPPSDCLNLIEATILDSLYDCCGTYGLYLSDIDRNLFKLTNVYLLTITFLDLVCDDSKTFSESGDTDGSDIDKLVDYLNDRVDLEINDVEGLIDDVDTDLIDAIENNEFDILESENKLNYLIFRRLNDSKLLGRISYLKDIILSVNVGFNFNEMLALTLEELLNIENLNDRTLEYIALLLASNVTNADLASCLNDTIDKIGSSDEEIMQLRMLAKKNLLDIGVR